MDYISKVKKLATASNLKMHLDGARGLNAAAFLDIDPAHMVKHFDTVNFCMSKGMGCPVGSLIMGTAQDMEFARVLRKMLGGQMRQIGMLATCGLISLEDWKVKLNEDHQNAKYIAQELS